MPITPFTVVAIAILVACGLVLVYILLRLLVIVVQIAASVRKDRLPKPQFNHPAWGTMFFDQGIWTGQVELNGHKLTVAVSGNPERPAPQLLTTLETVLADFQSFGEAALDFLLASNLGQDLGPESKLMAVREKFKPESVDCLWEAHPCDFALEFELEGDLDGAWRVEFEDGRPVRWGRDD